MTEVEGITGGVIGTTGGVVDPPEETGVSIADPEPVLVGGVVVGGGVVVTGVVVVEAEVEVAGVTMEAIVPVHFLSLTHLVTRGPDASLIAFPL